MYMENNNYVNKYINKAEYLNMLGNIIINEVLYTQIKAAFKELIPERKELNDEEIKYIFAYIRRNATRSKICSELNEKIKGKYMRILEKYSKEIDRHNRNIIKPITFGDYSLSIVLEDVPRKTVTGNFHKSNNRKQSLVREKKGINPSAPTNQESLKEYTEKIKRKVIERNNRIQKILSNRK